MACNSNLFTWLAVIRRGADIFSQRAFLVCLLPALLSACGTDDKSPEKNQGPEAVNDDDSAPPDDDDVAPDDDSSAPADDDATPPPPEEVGWVSLGGPPGGLGYDIRYDFSDHDRWYVTDAFGGFFASDDRGLTWTPKNTGMDILVGSSIKVPVFCVTVDPEQPSTVWTGTQNSGHVYKSTDRAATRGRNPGREFHLGDRP
jgi:hypothetical protein